MFERIQSWLSSSDKYLKFPVFSDQGKNTDFIGDDEDFSMKSDAGQDIELDHFNLQKVQERIRKCMEDDEMNENNSGNNGIENTLRMIRDETDRWVLGGTGQDNVLKREKHFDLHAGGKPNKKMLDDNLGTDGVNEELLEYCLSLERNNDFLLDLVTRFDEVSFKKRYDGLKGENLKLKDELQRLREVNGKVYDNYCELVQDVRREKKQKNELKKVVSKVEIEIKQSRNNEKDLERKVTQLENDVREKEEKLKIADKKCTHLRGNLLDLQRQLRDKENEIIKMKGQQVAFKMKLENHSIDKETEEYKKRNLSELHEWRIIKNKDGDSMNQRLIQLKKNKELNKLSESEQNSKRKSKSNDSHDEIDDSIKTKIGQEIMNRIPVSEKTAFSNDKERYVISEDDTIMCLRMKYADKVYSE